jgi:Tol biopolymer transport system component
MRKTLQAKYITSEIHALLFISMWVLYSLFSQPMANGPSAVLFVILFAADFPISFVAFGVLFTSVKFGTIAALLWGLLGTLWWYLIGLAIDTRIRRYRERRAIENQQSLTTANADTTCKNCRRTEVLIAASAVGVLIVVSLAWAWNGSQGHFEKGKIGNLAFSPDSRSIVLVRSKGESSTIEEVDLASRKSTPIKTAIPCIVFSPTYSPDGKKIAFACRTNSDDHSRVFITDSDGRNLHPLFSSDLNSYDFAPHFTSEGRDLYFARSVSSTTVAGSVAPVRQSWDVYSASIDGKSERPITDRHFRLFGISFSGDGRKLVVSGDVSSGTQIYLYSMDEPDKGEIAIHPPIPNAPQSPVISDVLVSQDGRSVYFMAATDGKKAFDYDVYRLDLTSNLEEKLTSANGYATDLCVSNDGKTAAFLRWTSRWGSLPNLSRLYTLDLETKRLTPLDVTGTQ